jgi:methionyl-tRNA synthetase
MAAAISEGRTRPVAPDEVISNPLVEAGVIKLSAAGNAYVPGALKDLSISRTTFDWGIPVPTNPKHVVYVWLDALANYITAIGYGSDDPADKVMFEKYWPADLHLVGKEITRFHCVYWPAFLLAAGLPLPKSVVANGWLLFEESKMSKSRGNVVRTETILDAFGPLCPPVPSSLDSTGLQPGETAATREEALAPGLTPPTKAEQDLFAADVLRYFLLREIPFGQDGTFSFDALITRYNADLANGYGNLVSRTLSMIQKYFDAGIVPSPEQYLPHRRPERRLSTDSVACCLPVARALAEYDFCKAIATHPDLEPRWSSCGRSIATCRRVYKCARAVEARTADVDPDDFQANSLGK